MDFKNLKQVFIIAEIGQNHQGDIELAKQMIQKAKEAGVNCVKFQKSSLKDKFTKAALDKPYNSANSWGNTYGEHKEHLEFSIEQFKILKKYAENLGLVFSASAMDIVSGRLITEYIKNLHNFRCLSINSNL
jgi:sialic acid synthase